MPRRFLKDHRPNVPEGCGALPAGIGYQGISNSDGTAREEDWSNSKSENAAALTGRGGPYVTQENGLWII